MWHFADLQFWDPIIFICGLKTSESPQIHTFSPNKYSVEYNVLMKFLHDKKSSKRQLLRFF